MTSRYDYVAYDDTAKEKQARLKIACTAVSDAFDRVGRAVAQLTDEIAALPDGRGKTLAQGKLKGLQGLTGQGLDVAHTVAEECYMWCGKAIRDDQIARNGSAPLQEGRGDE